jgi:hypothetical protein
LGNGANSIDCNEANRLPPVGCHFSGRLQRSVYRLVLGLPGKTIRSKPRLGPRGTHCYNPRQTSVPFSGGRAGRALRFDQIEVAVAAAQQYGKPAAVEILIDEIVGVRFHFEDGFFERHRFVAVVVIHPVYLRSG